MPLEQCIALTADYRLHQPLKGHRYSVDDMIVAHLAVTRGGAPRRVLDLGCGLGSVLLISAWAWPEATFVGVEALAAHVGYARRNVALNRCEERVTIVEGDLRDPALLGGLGGSFDLVTGSPPYFDPAAGTLCADPSRAAAHFELRGGIEDYAAAARGALRPGGLFVACAGALPEGRGGRALAAADLTPRYQRPVVPREGKPPFLDLLVAERAVEAGQGAEVELAPPLVLRDAAGGRTAEHRAIREWTGLPA